jgi:hypothetical protein
MPCLTSVAAIVLLVGSLASAQGPARGHHQEGCAHCALVLHATAARSITVAASAAPAAMILTTTVNGVYPVPTTMGVECLQQVGPSGECGISGTFVLDGAEAAHPGTFVGKPLSMVVYAGELPGPTTGDLADVALEARLERRR